MSDESINSSLQNVNGPGYVAPVESGSQTQAPKGHSQIDSLSRAEQEALVSMMMAGYPSLPTPGSQEIVSNMLNSWSEAIAEDSERVREYLTSAAYQVWIQNNSPSAQSSSAAVNSVEAQQSDQRRRTDRADDPLTGDLTAYFDQVNSKDPAAVGALPFALVNFIVPGALVSGVIDIASTGQVAVNPIVDSSFFSNIVANPALPLGDMRAELSMLGSIFAAGALNYADANRTAQAIEKKQVPNNNNLALNYGDKVLSLVSNSQFDQFLAGMFSGKNLSPEKLNERIASFKLVLLASALMAIYTSETKHISEGDFLGLANGTTSPRSKTEADLSAAFQSIKNSGLISQNVYQQLVEGLASYAGKNPDFSSFFKVDNAFAAISERANMAHVPETRI